MMDSILDGVQALDASANSSSTSAQFAGINQQNVSPWILDWVATVIWLVPQLIPQISLSTQVLLLLLMGLEHLFSSDQVVFVNNLTLCNVFHIASLDKNPIPVSQLTKSLNCCLTFFTTHCVLQDPKTGTKIGNKEISGLLFFFLASKW